MRKCIRLLPAAGVLLGALLVTPCFAEDSPGKSKPDETSRIAGTAKLRTMKAKPLRVIKTDRSALRTLGLDADPLAFTLVGRSSKGKDLTIAPGQRILDAIKNVAKPATAAEGRKASRDVIGKDNRVRVADAAEYPYSTIGYLEMEDAKGDVWMCTAALVGERTALTAANCLYDHDQDGGWYENYSFWPAKNGDSGPYGGFNYDTAYVFQAFITEYDGSYNSIWMYNVGLLTFSEPIGDSVGYLGSSSNDPDELKNFQGILVGDDYERPPGYAMWRSTCNIKEADISQMEIIHDCDAGWGSEGAPLFYYNTEKDDRIVVGVYIGQSDGANWAIRLYGPIYEWIRTIDP